VQAVLSGNVDAVTTAVIAMSTDPDMPAPRRAELATMIDKAFCDAQLSPLGYDFALALYREGVEGLIKRTELAMNLASAISRQGITLKGEYLHLARSISAMLGSLSGLYKGLPTTDLLRDLAQILLLFPSHLGLEYVSGQRMKLLRRLANGLPPPMRTVSGLGRFAN
jgi:hypothetical protein